VTAWRVSTYQDMIAVIRARIEELDVTYSFVDDAAGLQDGYTAKLLTNPPMRRASPYTQFLIYQALGLVADVRVSDEQPAFMRVQLWKYRRRVKRPAAVAGDEQVAPQA
jgi:hypothetical protein